MRRGLFIGGCGVAAVCALISLTASAQTGERGEPLERQIQIYRINFDSATVTLKNMSGSPISLNGFRFCTQSPGQLLRYTAATGLNGITLAAGAELYIHWNNDGPVAADHRNLSSLGGLAATPLIREAYAMSLYWPAAVPINFSNPAHMADHCQWSSTGADPGSSVNVRSDEAVTAGLWTAVADWIDTEPNTRTITLTDLTGGILHGPGNYDLQPACFGDITPMNGDGSIGDGTVSIADVNLAITSFGLGPGPADIMPAPAGDGQVTIADVTAVLTNFGLCSAPPP
jgi:hypothetical protein